MERRAWQSWVRAKFRKRMLPGDSALPVATCWESPLAQDQLSLRLRNPA